MFIAFSFILFFYTNLFSYSSDNPPPILLEEPEKPHYDNHHADDTYRMFGVGRYGNKRHWFGLNWVSKDSALFERHWECKKWTQKDYIIAIIHLFRNEVSYRDDYSALINGYTIFHSQSGRHFYINKNNADLILNQIDLYEYPEFRNVASRLPGYANKVRRLHSLIQSDKALRSKLSKKAINAIAQEYELERQREVAREKAQRELQEQQARQELEQAARKKLEEKHQEIRNTFNDSLPAIKHESRSWSDVADIARDYGLLNEHLQKRKDSLGYYIIQAPSMRN